MRLNMTDLNKQFQVYQLMTILKTKHLNIMNMKLNIDYILQPENEDDWGNHGFENEEASWRQVSFARHWSLFY